MTKRMVLTTLIVSLGFFALCLVFGPRGNLVKSTSAQGTKEVTKEVKVGAIVKSATSSSAPAIPAIEDNQLTPKSPAAYDPDWERGDYPQDQRNKLLAFPNLRPGDITPVKLYLYGGPGTSSYASIDDVRDV